MKAEVANEGIKAVPPVAVSIAATAQGWTMSDWVALSTVFYIALQAAYLIWKWHKESKK